MGGVLFHFLPVQNPTAMGHVPCPGFTAMERAFLTGTREATWGRSGRAEPKQQEMNRNTTKSSPQIRDLWPEMTLGNNNPVPVSTRTSAIKTAATKEKHRQRPHAQCTVNREGATQPNATQTPPPSLWRMGRAGKAQKTFFSTILSLFGTEQ